MKQEKRNNVAVKVAKLLKGYGADIFDCFDILQNLEDRYIKELEGNINNMDGEPSGGEQKVEAHTKVSMDAYDKGVEVGKALGDVEESKESKIADELNKDYPNIKDYPKEDPNDFCKKCGTMLIYSEQEKVFICPKCVKTKQSASDGKK